MTQRAAAIERETKETQITASLKLDGSGQVEVDTGVGFLDHMLTSAMVHGFFDLTLKARGDTHVDDHHTVEDVGIVLGQAFNQALGDFTGLKRFGNSVVPMDEALASAVIDLSRRPYLVFEASLDYGKVGNFDTQLVEEFWRGFVVHCGANLHLEVVRGKNTHHIFEAVFKAAGRALDQASQTEPRVSGALSTKGTI
jgi:imidazoleglycerol-phosphate dehydratase